MHTKINAIVLAGGFGTRLRPLTCELPKPMVPIGKYPVMAHVVSLLQQYNVRDMTAMLYFNPDSIRNYFGDGATWNVNMNYVIPPADFGTAGASRYAYSTNVLNKDIPTLIVAADIFTDLNLDEIIEFHFQKKSDVTMVLKRVSNSLQYGSVSLDENNRILKFLEKPAWNEVFSDIINTGIYILNPSVFKFIPENSNFDFSNHLFPKLLAKNIPMYGYITKGYWRDVGNIKEYYLANMDVLNHKVHLTPMMSSVLKPVYLNGVLNKKILSSHPSLSLQGVQCSGSVIIGENVKLGTNCRIENSIIGDTCVIGKESNIINSVVFQSVKIGNNVNIVNSIISNAVNIKDKARMQDAIISEKTTVGKEVVIYPNVKVWPSKIIKDHAILSSDLVVQKKWKANLFKHNKISGTEQEMTPEFAARLGAAYGSVFKHGDCIVISRDETKISRMIKRAFMSGVLSTGINVGDVRITPLPVLRFQIGNHYRGVGGVHICKSATDINAIDICFIDLNYSDIHPNIQRSIEKFFFQEDFNRKCSWHIGEIYTTSHARDFYVSGFLKHINTKLIQKSKFKIVIDYSFSSASIFFPSILGALGLEVIALNAFIDPNNKIHTKKELKKSKQNLSSIVRSLHADIGFLIDNRAERLFVFNEKGKELSDTQSLFLFIFLTIRSYPHARLSIPINQSKHMETLIQKHDCTLYRVPLEDDKLIRSCSHNNISFAGNGRGNFLFPEFSTAYDAMYSIVKLLEMMAHVSIKVCDIVSSMKGQDVRYHKMHCAADKKGKVMRLLISEIHQSEHNGVYVDNGIKIDFSDGWILILVDAIEHCCHLWIEKDEDIEQMLENYINMLKAWTH